MSGITGQSIGAGEGWIETDFTHMGLRRGDVLRFHGPSGGVATSGVVPGPAVTTRDYVWSFDAHTITVASGWHVWYLRLLHNPLRSLLEYCFRPRVRVFERTQEGSGDA